jgi:hypothetical protein
MKRRRARKSVAAGIGGVSQRVIPSARRHSAVATTAVRGFGLPPILARPTVAPASIAARGGTGATPA